MYSISVTMNSIRFSTTHVPRVERIGGYSSLHWGCLDHAPMNRRTWSICASAYKQEVSIVPTRRLGTQEAIEAWQRANSSGMETNRVQSLFSSQLGGIVTDACVMGINLDESLLLHGHGVYEHVHVVGGYVYQLDDRVDRLIEMSDRANIRLPKKWHKDQLKRTILETVAAGKCMDGTVTVLLSLGRSHGVAYGLGASDQGGRGMEANLYAIVTREDPSRATSDEYLRGYRVKTSPIPCKYGYFARLKSMDRFQDTMVMLDAQSSECNTGVYVDEQGNVAGVPEANVAFVMKGGVLVIPETEHTVATLTMSRLIELVNNHHTSVDISRIEKRPVSVDEAKSSEEMMIVGSQYPVMPVVAWDGEAIGDGEAGIVSLQIRTLLQTDACPPKEGNTDLHTEVPYGYLTGMMQ